MKPNRLLNVTNGHRWVELMQDKLFMVKKIIGEFYAFDSTKGKKITISLPTEILSKAFEKYSRNYKTKNFKKLPK